MLSIIIPTHNRVDSLVQTLDSILTHKQEAPLEIVIVDNNSTDKTREEVARYAGQYPGLIQYAFERRTAFSKARSTGAEQARGDVLLYIDDDVLIVPGSVGRIQKVFCSYSDAGIVAGKIMPKYSRQPPFWALRCQDSFNGWSLFEPFSQSNGKPALKEVAAAAGPMMAVRREIYDRVGGFPPDTIGVETNKGSHTFKKLYVGPGDGGLSHRVRESGYKIYFSPDVACYHVILPIRFTLKFWRSRVIGEGHYHAVSNREFYKYTPERLAQERKRSYEGYLSYRAYLTGRITVTPIRRAKRLVKLLLTPNPHVARFCSLLGRLAGKIVEIKEHAREGSFQGMYPEELWLHYYKAYLETDYLLDKYPDLGPFLWEIASEGVADEQFAEVVCRLPEEYRTVFVEETAIFDEKPLDSIEALSRIALHPSIEAALRGAVELTEPCAG